VPRVRIFGDDDLGRAPMIVTVIRTHQTDDGIFGNLAIDMNPFKCLTMELLSLAIPVGAYPVAWMWSEHFQQIMPQIIVPRREAIELHWANIPTQLEGCVALGTEVEILNDRIDESKAAWIGFIKAILNQPALMIKILEDYGL
jgi:hypothetical protein